MAESKKGLWMPAKERDRPKVLREVLKRHIAQKQAAGELGAQRSPGTEEEWTCHFSEY
jgi:hypothetical protein